MRWWQVYYAIRDSRKLNQSVELLLLASYFLSSLVGYSFEERKRLWDKAISEVIKNPKRVIRIIPQATEELIIFYERAGLDKKEPTTTGDTVSVIEQIHALLLLMYKEPDKVWNLRLRDVAEIIRAVKTIASSLGGKNEKANRRTTN